MKKQISYLLPFIILLCHSSVPVDASTSVFLQATSFTEGCATTENDWQTILDESEFEDERMIGEMGQLESSSGVILSEEVLEEDTTIVLPASYDLRDYGHVTSVKSQGSSMACVSYAVVGAIESNLITQGLADETIDLSESHLAWFLDDITYKDDYEPYTTGTTFEKAINTLANRYGLELEAFSPDELTNYPVYDDAQREVSYYKLENSYQLPNDAETIKRSIMTNGAVAACYYSDANYYNRTGSTYYRPYRASSNHAIIIIGWDDTYPASNFKAKPSSDGAWLCRNNWGTQAGDDGYFWISYKEPSLDSLASFEVSANQVKEKVYNYASNWNTWMTISDIKGANIYQSTEDEILQSISFPIGSPGNTTLCEYSVSVYLNPEEDNPESGNLLFHESGTLNRKFYHTIKLNTPVILSANEKVSVVLEIYDTKLGRNGIFMEYGDFFPCHSGETYYYCKGVWGDTTKMGRGWMNACISMTTLPVHSDDTIKEKLEELVSETEEMDFSTSSLERQDTITFALSEAKDALLHDSYTQTLENELIHLSLALTSNELTYLGSSKKEEAQEYDLNGDGNVTDEDVQLVLDYSVADESQGYTAVDALKILQYIAA
ncbi:MAG: C1 family peptidase [Lachnospiraceae bacterium]